MFCLFSLCDLISGLCSVMGAGLRLKKWGCSFYYSTKVQKITQTDEGVTYHQVEEEPTTEQIELELGDEPIITTAAQCEQAIKELYGHKAIAVDCEGVNLGRTGKLCLVQIGTPSKTYLFGMLIDYTAPLLNIARNCTALADTTQI